MTKKHVTMKDIAERCGVTHVTVSLALRDNPRISKATAKKIHAVAKEMGYDPSFQVSARRLALSRHGKAITNNVLGCV
ncbi:MAG TPA: LacI family DNA-binding transcriptional regulator, partial [Armatimonadota bacterium]|nr:LacI family DNA-binding transcriptional regulator [Armatimonadota bacterium]